MKLFAFVLALVATAIPLRPTDAVAAGKERPITIESDRIATDGDGKVIAVGDVTVIDGNKVMRGDSVRFDKTTRTGRIEGNVGYAEPGLAVAADAIDFNTDTGLGTLWRAKAKVGEYYTLAGEKIERRSDVHYLIDDGFVTTCDCDTGDPDWAFSAKGIDVTLEEFAYFNHLFVEVKGTPVFYLPWFMAPAKTKRATGFLIPGIGVSSVDGFQMENTFFWAFAENADATIIHHYLGEAGNRLGAEVRYILTPDDAGQFTFDYLAANATDRHEAGSAWKLYGDHHSLLPGAVDLALHAEKESDLSIDRLYADSLGDRSRRYTDSWLTLTRSWGGRTLRLTGREFQTISDDARQTLTAQPNVTFTNQLEPLFGSPIYGALESSYVSYRDSSSGAATGETFAVDRFDFAPTISLPLAVAPWLSLTPTAGYRLTHYSRGNEADPAVADKAFTRDFYTVGLNVTGPKVFRIFDTGSQDRPLLKHLITPSIDYTYVPSYDSHDGEDRQRVRVIDTIDTLGAPTNLVTFRLTNQFLLKEVTGATATTTMPLQFIVSQGYDLNEADRELAGDTDENRPLQPLVIDLYTLPFPWLLVNYQSSYDHYEKVESGSLLSVGFRYENLFHFALDRSYQRGFNGADDIVWNTLYTELNTPWNVSVDYSAVMNQTTGETADSALRAFYRRDCWSVGVGVRKRQVMLDDETGTPTLQDETVTTFHFTLRGMGDVMGAPESRIAGRKL